MCRSIGMGCAVGSMLALTVVGSSASAGTLTASCSADGHNNNDSATFSVSGSYHVWGTAKYKFTGGGTGGQSNMIIRIRANGVDKWAYDSPDNRANGTQYGKSLEGTKTAVKASEQMLFRAIFDTAGSDPSCNAYTGLL